MRVGLITGSGGYEWPGIRSALRRTATTPYGEVDLTDGEVAGVSVVHLSRHGAGHARLSSQVQHRANLRALIESEVDAVISMTVVGAVDPAATPGSLVVFDDLYFPSNRLPEGDLCTWHQRPGEAGRGHWIFEGPFNEPLRTALLDAAGSTSAPVVARGCYGHVDGPRFNTRAEIAALAAAGVTAVGQTAGPEVVLAGEAELPLMLLGFVTDYANGVLDIPEPVSALQQRMASSTALLAEVVEGALPKIEPPHPTGMVYTFD